VETKEGKRVEGVEEKSLVRASPVGPRSRVQGGDVRGRVPSGPSNMLYRGRGTGSRGYSGGTGRLDPISWNGQLGENYAGGRYGKGRGREE